MIVNLAHSAPAGDVTVALDPTTTPTTSDRPKATPGKPILRNEIDNTPGKCCASDPSKKCCPYDYDSNKCGILDNRTYACGYDKNQPKPVVIETTTIKYGLHCELVDDRLECGYGARSGDLDPVTEETRATNAEVTTRNTPETTTLPTRSAISSKATLPTTPETTTQIVPKTTIKASSETTTTTTKITSITTGASEQTEVVTKNMLNNCCSKNNSKSCCPYDYDDSKCDMSDNRAVCGYNKNQKETDNEPSTQFTKQGLVCQNRDERVECNYGDGSSVTIVTKTPTIPTRRSRIAGANTSEKNVELIKSIKPIIQTTTRKVTKPTKKRTKPKRPRRTTKECVEIHSKVACRNILLDEEMDYD